MPANTNDKPTPEPYQLETLRSLEAALSRQIANLQQQLRDVQELLHG